MYCSKCGNEIKEEEQFCSKCGNKIEENVKKNGRKLDDFKTKIIEETENKNNINRKIDFKQLKNNKVLIVLAIVVALILLLKLIGQYGIIIFLFIISLTYGFEYVSDSYKIWETAQIENTIENLSNDGDLAIYFAKDLLKKHLTTNEEIKWIKESIIENDNLNKYLVYLKYSTKNIYGVQVNSQVIVPILINNDNSIYSYKSFPKMFTINNENELNNQSMIFGFKKKCSWNKEVLYENEFKERYQRKNIFKNIKSIFIRYINHIKNNKLLKNTIMVAVIIISIVFINNVRKDIAYDIKVSKLPSLTGMSVNEASEIVNKLKFDLDVKSCGDSKEVISNQHIDGETVYIETEEYNESIKREREKSNKVRAVIEEHTEYVRNMNQGSVEYINYSAYATSKNGEKIYKIKYSTGSDLSNFKQYYYQLVSLDDDCTYINKSTKLYYFTVINGKDGAGQEDEMEWEAEQIWGI